MRGYLGALIRLQQRIALVSRVVLQCEQVVRYAARILSRSALLGVFVYCHLVFLLLLHLRVFVFLRVIRELISAKSAKKQQTRNGIKQ